MASRYHFLQNQRPSLGGELGSALGTGLGTGLAALAESKLDKMLASNQRAEDKQKLVSLGIPENEAEYLSHQDPDVQWQSARQWLIAGGAPEEMLPRTLDEEWNINPEQEAAAQQQVQQMLGQQQPQGPLAALEQMQPKVAQQPAPQVVPQEPVVKPAAQPKKLKGLGEAFKAAGEKTSTKEALALRKEQRDIQAAIDKETEPFYTETLEQGVAAKKNDQRLNKMENLVNKGGLPFSTFYNLFKNIEEHVPPSSGATAGALVGGAIGSVVPVLGTVTGAAVGGAIGGVVSPLATVLRGIQKWTSPNTEEYEKLSTDFIRDAKAIFGSRITDQDLRTFMQMIPTLSNTDPGKLAIIKNMRSFNKAAEVKADVMKQIIKENGGKRPANLPILVEERASKKLDKIAQDFERVG